MDQSKLNSSISSQNNDDLEVVQWQFQSDLEPYKQTDPAKWTWQNYLDDENLIIEEAYSLNQETVFLKDYEIDLKKMVQVHRLSKNNVRRVRRLEPSRFMMRIPKVNAIAKDQKTMNEAFGTVQHFLEYIMKRTPEAYTLYQSLKSFSLDCNRDQFEDLVREVIACIGKGAEVRAKIIKTRTGARVRDFISEARKLIEMIENNSATLRDFLKAILKAYTMETFICYWLNELLRSEHWEEINVLTPYLVCLVYIFKLSEYVLECRNSQEAINDRLGFVVKHKLHLYRGATLTEDELVSYNPNKVEYFSWNAVTSTSREKNIALKFMNLSFAKTKNIKVVFFIEIDFASLEDYHGLIDISKDSKYPKEQEVILAPGTVFQLREISLIENDVYQIHLKVRKDLETPSKDVHLLGALQEQAISKDRGVIDGLPSDKAFKVLELLRGNQLIKKLEIMNSGLEERIMEEIESVRVTTNIKKENIKLIGNTIIVRSFSGLAHYFTMKNLSDFLSSNKIRFGPGIVNNHQMASKLQIKRLVLSDQTIEAFQQNGQFEELWKRLKDEIQPSGVCLSILKTEIEDGEFKEFLKCIKEWGSLDDLDLTFNQRQKISTGNYSLFSEAISSSTTLIQLSLKFPFSDKGLSFLQNAFRPLECLQSLFLDCYSDSRISDEGLGFLKNSLTSLISLKNLSVKFTRCNFSEGRLEDFISVATSLKSLQNFHFLLRSCKKISDAGLKCLQSSLTPLTTIEHLPCDFLAWSETSSEGLNLFKVAFAFLASFQHFQVEIQFSRQISNKNVFHLNNALTSLTSLQHLDLKFIDYSQISDETFSHLSSALGLLTSLQHLSLQFKFDYNIPVKGLRDLNAELIPLTSLTYLSLNFLFCNRISDEDRELGFLKNALFSLLSLRHLSLDFKDSSNILDKGLNHLKSALISLTSLQHLSLGFLDSYRVSDEGLNYLSSAFLSLESLDYLSLNFSRSNISNDGLHYLSHMLSSLSSLQHLFLTFECCSPRLDEGLSYLSNTLLSLESLDYLSLNFSRCNISNEGLNCLRNGLLSIASLRHLFLNFECCSPTLDEGLRYLSNTLLSLVSLDYLSLNFSRCNISNGGLNCLRNGLLSIASLRHLSLNFEYCPKVSDEGLSYLSNALVLLTSLHHLSLDFSRCNISNNGIHHLCHAFSSLASLKHLSLSFEDCHEILDKGLNYLKNALILLTCLQHLSLSFSSCRGISDEGLNHLQDAIVLLTSLQHLEINCDDCERIPDESLENLKIALKSIPSLLIPKERLKFKDCTRNQV